MITLLLHLFQLLPFLFGGHRQLALENLALRQQLALYKVATGLFGLTWLLAPDHGLIATRLTRRGWRRRETSTARGFEVGVIEIPDHK